MEREVHAAGAVVWRVRDSRLEVLLVHRPIHGDWSWPKGKPKRNETLPACAIREVEEETGVRVVLGVPLPQVTYRLSTGEQKVNWYWAAQEVSDTAVLAARPVVRPAPDHEIDESVWVEAVTAMTMLTRRSDRAPLSALLDVYADDRLNTWAFVITRHARAKKRGSWAGGELDRPLTPKGRKQAKRLIPLFAAYGVTEIISSPWGRCKWTVEPFAHAAGLSICERTGLTEEGAVARPQKAQRLSSKALTSGTATVVCTHRPALPAVLAGAATHTPKRIKKDFPAVDPHLEPGESLILHVAPREGKKPLVVALERHLAQGVHGLANSSA